MKRALSISCLWICLLVLSSSVIMGQDNHLDITPTPQSLVQKNGHFTLNSKTSFAIGKNQRADLKKVAAYFQSKILYSTGYNLNIKNSGSLNAISLQIDKSLKIGNEGYQLTVTPKKVIVKAKTPQGIFYGMQSVMQLLPPQIESETIIDNVAWEIPCVEIKDEPSVSLLRADGTAAVSFYTAEDGTRRSANRDVTEKTAALADEIAALTLTACVDYDPAEGAAAVCGLDTPEVTLMVNYLADNSAERTLILAVGLSTGDGGRYVALDGDTTIYRMEESSLTQILTLSETGL